MSTIEEAREQARAALSEDGFFNREQSTIVRALLDATEPPEIQYADSATVAALAEKIAGENAELMERLAVKPAEDEPHFHVWSELPCKPGACRIAEPAEDERVAAELEAERRWPSPNSGLYEGLRIGFLKGAEWAKGPRPITDEMVEAARRAWRDADGNTRPGTRMRAALEAAEEARR